MRKQFVYTVTMHYDSWDHYSLGIADTLPVAKRLAQTDYTAYELPDVAPTLKWYPRDGDSKRPWWVAPAGAYGKDYRISKHAVVTTREVP